jgi:choline dehydrogenase-like flavoprotein
MLESGGRRPRGMIVRAAGNTVLRYVSHAEIRRDRHASATDADTRWFSSLSLGGLSNYWTGAVPRFDPADFDEGARIDERYRWPIGYDDVAPFYSRAERYLDITGVARAVPNLPMNDIRYATTLAPGWTDLAERSSGRGVWMVPLPMAKGSPWMIAMRPTEFNSYTRIVRPLCERDDFELVRNAHVQDLTWSPSPGRVSGVRYIDRRTGELRSMAADAVVVAAGALDTTRILLSSTTTDHPDGLGNADGVLGRYVHDHPKEWWMFETERPLPLPAHPVYIPRENPASSPPLMAASHTIGLASPRDRPRTFFRGRGRRFGVQIFGTMRPADDMRVSLSRSAVDEFGQAALDIDMHYDSAARDNLRRARQRLFDAFAEAGNPVRGPDAYPLLEPGSSVHYGGTVRMHDRREYGVLDRWNRVRDVPNVVVADSSCFTTGPEKNPTLTAMAIAIRASDHLADELFAAQR